MDPFVAEIRIFPFNFAPTGWAFCAGQVLPLSQNTALFSLLGTTYGGNGQSNFALPDLQGRAPMHPGQGPGLSLYDLGEIGGTEAVALLQNEIPSHSHGLQGRAGASNGASAVGTLPATGSWVQGASFGVVHSYTDQTPATDMSPNALGPTGGGQPHNNMQPYLTLSFCIALQGVFPPRG